MRNPDPTSIPDGASSVIVALLIGGVGLGVVYGLGLISILVLDAVFFGALAVFVPWAVWKFDPHELSELGDSSDSDA
jgi:hypothetical protein